MEPLLFKYFPREKTIEIIKSYQSCTGLHVQLIDMNGEVIFTAGKPAAFCTEFAKYPSREDSCAAQHAAAGKKALSYGESYLFNCQAGLSHIVYPLISKDTMFGSVVAGPFLMDEADSSLVLDLDRKYNIDKKSLLYLSELSYRVKVLTPAVAYEYSKLLYYLIDTLNVGSREMLILNQQKILQQSRINESIQMYKSSGMKDTREYPLDKESLLITKIKLGDLEESRRILNELLGFILLYENYDLGKLKVRIIELCSLLSRAAIERGSDINMVLTMNEKLISSIMNSNDFYEICYKFQDNMEIFTESLFYSSDNSNRMIKEAAEYISKHFSENISLADVADVIHLNPSYFSSLFKQVTGESFKEYLNKVRIEEAKSLLEHTDYSIIEIAVACGYSDQSYFTKVFKKTTGITPKQYR